MIKLKMDRGARPIRSRKHNRSWTPVQGDSNRPIKRLFTPEIKRMLKDWLVRRRENPYPSREEKKSLAQKTGLTYIQICNWFANWRRKLKNAGKEPQKNTWGHLIKNYNNNARGNVEQFSICSSDSIWEDEERRNEYIDSKIGIKRTMTNSPMYFNSFIRFDENAYVNATYKTSNTDKNVIQSNVDEKCDATDVSNEQCYQFAGIDHSQVSSTTNNNNINDSVVHTKANTDTTETESKQPPNNNNNCFSNPKYKNQIMEKYLQSLDGNGTGERKGGLELSKWLESTAKFTPDKNNYIEWDSKKMCSNKEDYQDQYMAESNMGSIHQKDELDAAEALTYLAGNFKSRWVK
ncbi:homeobox protein Mohawk isoform X2 [Contarinia nasturtii]|uniref:homeobox protein Mohawk isoform X2 n=1 Tax=Contarinia nasturtii TaxID=265458 RepID=UPI0012D3A93C|nr:homeobox protein Mohawk isoform X2 [Contarinia nasturtii]